MADDSQTPLFPGSSSEQQTQLRSDSPLHVALTHFEQHMLDKGFAVNTVKAFVSDIRLLGKYLGPAEPLDQIGTQNLNDFLNWLVYERGVPCSPKSYARRVTTLKVFFGWLADSEILLANPATAVIQKSVSSPLPNAPAAVDVDRALAVTQRWREGEDSRKPDVRPHMLLNLLLETGIKKGEAMALEPDHIDSSDEDKPFIFVKYKNPRLRYKERKIAVSQEWLDIFDEYMRQYRPETTVFTCTARNLEYILSDIAEAAGLEKGHLSFENLRWAAAMRDYRANSSHDEIRQKLGLSKVTWRETKNKLDKIKSKQDAIVV